MWLTASEIDHLLGERIKSARQAAGLSQTELGKALDLSFQQIQKYEKGMDRLRVSTLVKLADFLDLPVIHFLKGLSAKA